MQLESDPHCYLYAAVKGKGTDESAGNQKNKTINKQIQKANLPWVREKQKQTKIPF